MGWEASSTACSPPHAAPLRLPQASLRQVEARAAELKAAAEGHEARAAEAGAELARANAQLERLGVSTKRCAEGGARGCLALHALVLRSCCYCLHPPTHRLPAFLAVPPRALTYPQP